MSQPLTERQNQAYEFIASYLQAHKKPPTLKEIGDALSIRSSNGVFKLLKVLVEKGYIIREENTARGIRLIRQEDMFEDEQVPSIPIVGRATSQQPDLLRRNARMSMFMDFRLMQGLDEAKTLIARAGDDGMNTEGIYKGDYLLIQETRWQELQDTLVAFLVEDKLIARRLNIANGKWHLRPSARNYTEEIYPPGHPQCYVVGRIAGVLRKL